MKTHRFGAVPSNTYISKIKFEVNRSHENYEYWEFEYAGDISDDIRTGTCIKVEYLDEDPDLEFLKNLGDTWIVYDVLEGTSGMEATLLKNIVCISNKRYRKGQKINL